MASRHKRLIRGKPRQRISHIIDQLEREYEAVHGSIPA